MSNNLNHNQLNDTIENALKFENNSSLASLIKYPKLVTKLNLGMDNNLQVTYDSDLIGLWYSSTSGIII